MQGFGRIKFWQQNWKYSPQTRIVDYLIEKFPTEYSKGAKTITNRTPLRTKLPMYRKVYRGLALANTGFRAYQGARRIYRQLRKRPKYKRRFRRGYNRTGGYYRKNGYGGKELKFFDDTVDDVLVSTGGTIISPSSNTIQQGTGEKERIGRKCIIRQIDWKIRIGLVTTTNPTFSHDLVRLILYVDKQCNGAAATVLDILETASVLSFRNLANTNRFQVLFDRSYSINATAGGGSGAGDWESGGVEKRTKYHKNCFIPIEFSGTTGAITEIQSNNIGILSISAVGGAFAFTRLRLRFTG